MIRVLIGDDHALVREGIKQILRDGIGGSLEFGEASSGQEVVERAAEAAWDVLILDLRMPGRSGLDVIRQLRHEQPGLPILVLSVYAEEQFAVRVLRGGAAGYLTKGCAPEEMVAAVRKVLSGGKYISPAVAEQIAHDLDIWSVKLSHDRLSDREFQVLQLIAQGMSPTEIAQELSLSPKTVGTYRSHILQKLRLKSNQDLIYYALQHGLVD